MSDSSEGTTTSETTATTEETTTTASADDKKFTQAELDYHISERLKRQRAQFPDQAELDALREKAGKFDEIDAQSKSDLEKANEKIAALEAAAAKATTEAREAAKRAAIVAEAAKRNVVDPDAAVALIGQIDFDDAGTPQNIAAAMDSLLADKPYLVASAAGGARAGSADQGARSVASDQLTRDDLKTMTDVEIVQAQKEGRLKSVMGVS